MLLCRESRCYYALHYSKAPRQTQAAAHKNALIVIFRLESSGDRWSPRLLAVLDALQFVKILVVRFLIGAVEERVLALMQRMNIVVMVVHDALVRH